MPFLLVAVAGLIVIVAVLRFGGLGGLRMPPKAARTVAMIVIGGLALFLAAIERWLPAVFLGSICWTIYTGGRALPRDWMDAAGPRAEEEEQEQAPPPRRDRATMSRAEALKVLGLSEGASEDDIRAAHRRLILQNHPDKGGSDYLASKVNEAKDVLLG
jgi:hypothetical protein